MKSIIKKLLIVPALVLGIGMMSAPVMAANINQGITGGVESAKTKDSAPLFQDGGDGGLFKTVANVLLFIIGAISVIMLIIGGIKYTTSNGDQNAVTGAKNTIMYAIIGLVVAMLSWALVQFVVSSLSSGSAG